MRETERERERERNKKRQTETDRDIERKAKRETLRLLWSKGASAFRYMEQRFIQDEWLELRVVAIHRCSSRTLDALRSSV